MVSYFPLPNSNYCIKIITCKKVRALRSDQGIIGGNHLISRRGAVVFATNKLFIPTWPGNYLFKKNT